MAEEPASQRKALRAGGLKRRKQILEATLRVILRDGIRGVRHRAVAEEAQVPLASTTYYFKDLEELLSETFLFWNHGASIYAGRLKDEVAKYLDSMPSCSIHHPDTRKKLESTFSSLSIDYVLDQINNHQEDRQIELAFHHEATRNAKLRLVVRNRLNSHLESMAEFYELIGSPNPKADAQATISLLLRLEQDAVMDDEAVDRSFIESTLSRHLHVMFLASENR